MPKNKKLDVHMVQHTHWDREWYFTSDDCRTMLYYDMKFLIDHLEKNDDVFTFDAQASVIEDFLMFSPEWKGRMEKLIADKKLLVGPFYTQTDNTIPMGESISRNIEIGNKMAKDAGYSMQVGYLPDTFGHNNQTAQIFNMNGIKNFSFYRGLDPNDTDNQLYFWYKSPDGTKILGHWQTHYSTHGQAFKYTQKAFEDFIVDLKVEKGRFDPSVFDYAKRNYGLPIAIPIGTDQRPFRKEVKEITTELNKKYPQYNFLTSDYDSCLREVEKQIKENKIKIKTVTKELRQAFTGRVHRSVISSRMDIKQKIFALETLLINVLEPMSILCEKNNIDVPWKMIEHCWKELFKSSAHDSYGCTNEDVVNRKIYSRTNNALRVGESVLAMLSRIYANKLVDEENDQYAKLMLFNYENKPYSGIYEFETTVKKGYDNGKFQLFDGEKEVKYSILKTNNIGTHERDALTLLINVKNVPSFSHKILDIKYLEDESIYVKKAENTISNTRFSLTVNNNNIQIVDKKKNKTHNNPFKVVADPSVGDTYDHSPITFNDKKYDLTNYSNIKSVNHSNCISFTASAKLPNGIQEWTENTPSKYQNIEIKITLIDDKIHAKIYVKNNVDNTRLSLLVDSQSSSSDWYHDQQYGIYKRNINNQYMETWNKPCKYGYTWDEYPTNLSPHQTFISNDGATFTTYTQGTREHELINYEGKKQFSITLYRAFGVFGTSKFLYRPGRGSGAHTDAPDCQLKDKQLEFGFMFDFNNRTLEEQFLIGKQMRRKNYYIPKQWALDRTILRWETDINYYDNDNANRTAKIGLPNELQADSYIMTALYKDPYGRQIARFLNIGDSVKINKSQQWEISRTLENFSNDSIELPKFGLFNILV